MTRLGNMFLACSALLVAFMAEAGCHSALSSGPPRVSHGPVTLREVLVDSVAVIWIAGAVGVSSGRRFGWIPSLIGTGATAIFFGSSFVGIWILYFSPEEPQLLAGVIIGSALFAGLCMACVAVFIGLIKMRKELR